MEWEGCGDGCRVRRGTSSRAVTSTPDPTYGVLHALLSESEETGYRTVVVAPNEGPPIAGWRGPLIASSSRYVCVVGPFSSSGGHAGVVLTFLDDEDARNSEQWILAGPTGLLGAMATAAVHLPPGSLAGTSYAAKLWVTPTQIVYQLSPGGTLIRVADGVEQVMTLEPFRELPTSVRAIGDHLFWAAYGDPVRLIHARRGGPPEELLAYPDADAMSFTAAPDGLAWLRVRDARDEGPAELWTSDLPDRPADLSPRRVRTIEPWTSGTAGEGWYGYTLNLPSRLELIRLRDGEWRRFVAPEGLAVRGDPSLFLDGEVYVPGNAPGVRGGLTYRLRVDALAVVEPG